MTCSRLNLISLESTWIFLCPRHKPLHACIWGKIKVDYVFKTWAFGLPTTDGVINSVNYFRSMHLASVSVKAFVSLQACTVKCNSENQMCVSGWPFCPFGRTASAPRTAKCFQFLEPGQDIYKNVTCGFFK